VLAVGILGLSAQTHAITDSVVKKPAAPVWDGPFGLEKGLSLKTIQAHYKTTTFIVKQPHTYWLPNPPKKSNAFPMIAATITPKAGVCAVSGNRVEKSDGTQIVRTIIQIVSDLSTKYGQPTTLSSGRALWTLNKTAAPLQSILVASDQISEDITLISVIYRFDNYEQCKTEWADETTETKKQRKK